MSSYVVRTRSTEGEGRYAVHERHEALDVWARQGATLTSVVALVTFLNAHCADMGAHDVRRMLAPIGDLAPLPNPPSALAPTDRVPMPTAAGVR